MAAPRRTGAGQRPVHGVLYEQLLLFPERAEYLEQDRYSAYRARLDHWRDLSSEFRRAFEAVYERRSACILLVHGAQGTGKTLFTRKLEDDFEQARIELQEDQDNLWHVLAGGSPIDASRVQRATASTTLRRITPQTGWLDRERTFARDDTHAMRVFIIDDFHRDAILRELANLSQGEYLRLKADGKDSAVLESVAQQLVEDCRGDFARSLFVLLSNDQDLLRRLHEQLERSHTGLARPLSLPLPAAALKEEIVRTNTNRLNPRSYWYCLDQGGPEEKQQAYRTLMGPGGFIDSFQAVDRALGAGARRRSGRPANKNLLTLVTLGADPLAVQSFIDDAELASSESLLVGSHVGVWLFRETWASTFGTDGDAVYARKAGLVESEFALRWVALDSRGTWCLCAAPAGDALAAAIAGAVEHAPRMGETKSAKQDTKKALDHVNAGLAALQNGDEIAAFAEAFRAAGQGRSRLYEPAVAQRFPAHPFGRSFAVFGEVKPDVVFEEYQPCAVTSATSEDTKAIENAIRRGCHVVEFTAHLQADLRGLADYVREKVLTYATLLESV